MGVIDLQLGSRIGGCAIALLLAGLLSGLAAQPAVAGQGQLTSRSPQALVNALDRLDRRIKETSVRISAGQKLSTYLDRRQRETGRIVDRYMRVTFSGVEGSAWFRSLDCAGDQLGRARLRERGALRRGRSAAMLASARGCVQRLRGALSGAGGASVSLDSELAAFEQALAGAITTAGAGGDIAPLLPAIEQRGPAIADSHMRAPISGVQGSRWFRKLNCVSRALAKADLRDDGKLMRGSIRGMLREARGCARTLGSALNRARHRRAQPNESTLRFGSNNLTATPRSLVGRFNEDIEYWPASLAPQPAEPGYIARARAPRDGIVTEIKLRGYALSGDNPAGSAQPIRFSVARPLSRGQARVITTTDPPFMLPGTDGIRSFSMSAVRWLCCSVKKGDLVSLDARFGEHAVFASLPGAATRFMTHHRPGTPSQNPGFVWTPEQVQGAELLMQVTMQPYR